MNKNIPKYKQIKYCVDCNIKISYQSTRCFSCEGKRKVLVGIINVIGKNNPMFGIQLLGKKNGNYKGGKPNCIDCGVETKDYKSLRCLKCYKKYCITQRSLCPGVNGSFCNKIISPQNKHCKNCDSILKTKNILDNFCVCGAKITRRAKQCRVCFYRNRHSENSSNYKDGRSLKDYYCKCGNKIHKNTALYKGGLCRQCYYKNISGNSSHFWNGGISSLAALIRCSLKYKKWRTTIFKRDNYTCQQCKQVGCKLNVDHIIPFSSIFNDFLKLYSQFSPIEDKETLVRLAEGYEPFWDLNNGRTLCIDCHKKTNTYGKKAKKHYSKEKEYQEA